MKFKTLLLLLIQISCCHIAFSQCPTYSSISTTAVVCSGNLTTEYTMWQGNVEGNNPVTDAAGTFTEIIYSSTNDPAAPDGDESGITGINETCAALDQVVYAFAGCDENGDGAADSYALVGTFTLTVIPALSTDITNPVSVCSATTDAIVVNLVAADGTVCDSQTFDAPANETCATTTATFDYEWTIEDLEAILGVSECYDCYEAIMGTEEITIFPAQPTLNIVAEAAVCSAETDIITIEILAADGTICNTENFDAPENLGCTAIMDATISGDYTAAEIATIFGDAAGVSCYTDLTYAPMFELYPDANNFTVTETPGACGVAAKVEVFAEDGTLCFEEMGDIPTSECPDPSSAILGYTINTSFDTDCNATFSGTVPATCEAPPICCPDITATITPQAICSGGAADTATAETEITVTGSNAGTYTYFADAAYTTPYAGEPLLNETCEPIDITIYGRLQCTDPDAAGTPDEYDDFSFVVTVYPAQPALSLVSGDTEVCSGAANEFAIELLAADGTVCDTKNIDLTANNFLCAATQIPAEYGWTIAEIEALTGTPADVACYTDASDTQTITVYPASPTIDILTSQTDVCSGEEGVFTVALLAADATTICDIKLFDADANNTCERITQTIDYAWTATEIEAITGASADLMCYTDLSGTEDITVYPAAPTIAVADVVIEACSKAEGILTVNLLAADGTSICATQMFDASTNTSCEAIPQTIDYAWTAAEIEALTGAIADLMCYEDLSGTETISVYPDASSFVVVETEGACGTAATVTITAEDGTECYAATGAVPAAGECPDTNGEAPLDYEFDPAFPVFCNTIFSGTVDAVCAPIGCIDCPDIMVNITPQAICSGDAADIATAESEVTVMGVNVGDFSYFIDATYTIPYAGEPLFNAICEPTEVTIYGRLQCTDPDVVGTADEYDDFSFVVTVYPAQPSLVVADVAAAACSAEEAVITVNLVSASGFVICDSQTFDAPENLTCEVMMAEEVSGIYTADEISAILGVPADADCYEPLDFVETLDIYPNANEFIVNEIPGTCGTAASVEILAEDGSICITEMGNIPPAGECPTTNGEATLAYQINTAYIAACNATFSGTVTAICEPFGCCPDIEVNITPQVICSGTAPDLAVAESEITVAGPNVGDFSYFTDVAYTMPYDGESLINDTCEPTDVTIYGRLQCTNPDVAGTADEYDDFSFVVTVYPAAPSIVVLLSSVEVCSEASEVITVKLYQAATDEECDEKSFDAPANLTCEMVTEEVSVGYTATEVATILGTPTDTDCYEALTFTGTFDVYPDASNFIVVETEGACGTAATVTITAEDGTECYAAVGEIPATGECPDFIGEAPLEYTFDPAFLASCNAVFSGTVDATCAPIGCINCPDIMVNITPQTICSGDVVDIATAESEVTVMGANAGDFSYFTDAAYTMPYDGEPLINETCEPIDIIIYGRLQCTDPNVAGTAEEYDDFSFVVTVYPAQPTIIITNTTTEACSDDLSIISINLVAVDGSVCATQMLDAPENLTCSPMVATAITGGYTAAQIATIFTVPTNTNCYVPLTFTEMVDIYPDASAFIVNETSGGCDIAASIEILAQNGVDICFSDTGVAPVANPPCGNVDSQPLTYSFDPGFAATCNETFSGTIEAECELTCGCGDPCYEEYDPTLPADNSLCINLLPSDLSLNCPPKFSNCTLGAWGLNPSFPDGIYGGTGLPYIDIPNNMINLDAIPPGTYTITYEIPSGPDCPLFASCTFTVLAIPDND